MTLPSKECQLLIYEQLQKAFLPTMLEVIDDSAKHVGHVGSTGGAGHYTIVITADCFKHKSQIDIHREIYSALNHLIPSRIHALQIKIVI
jgi:BolA protein